MLELVFKKDRGAKINLQGNRIEILAALPIVTGKALYQLLKDCPDGLKDMLTKNFFEQTLEMIKMEGERNVN